MKIRNRRGSCKTFNLDGYSLPRSFRCQDLFRSEINEQVYFAKPKKEGVMGYDPAFFFEGASNGLMENVLGGHSQSGLAQAFFSHTAPAHHRITRRIETGSAA